MSWENIRDWYIEKDDDCGTEEMSDEEIAQARAEYEANTVKKKCTECGAEISIYVGRDSDALDHERTFSEPKTEEEEKLFSEDPFYFENVELVIRADYLICGECCK